MTGPIVILCAHNRHVSCFWCRFGMVGSVFAVTRRGRRAHFIIEIEFFQLSSFVWSSLGYYWFGLANERGVGWFEVARINEAVGLDWSGFDGKRTTHIGYANVCSFIMGLNYYSLDFRLRLADYFSIGIPVYNVEKIVWVFFCWCKEIRID